MLGISVDSVYAHEAFAEQLGGLGFPLLADFHPKGAVAQAYGVWRDDKGYSHRAIVIVDAAGVVRYREVVERGAPDVENILTLVRSISSA